MKYKIGVFGSNANELDSKMVHIAKQTGHELALQNVVVITGAGSGIPYIVAYEAAKKGVEVWGFSPMTDNKGQEKFAPRDDVSIYKKLFFVPKTFVFASDLDVSKKYRNVISTANCDAGIIISGRWGTFNEFTNLYDMGKIIGVLTGTGGIADELFHLNKKISKKSKAKIIFSNVPRLLIEKVIGELNLRNT